MSTDQYPHLNEVARALMDKTDQQRIYEIKRGSWIPYTRAKEVLEHMEELFEHPPIDRMPNMLLVGASNNAKTQIMKRFLRNHPPDPNPEGDYSIIPVLFVEAPDTPDIDALYMSILDTINKPYIQRSKHSDRVLEVYEVLRAVQLKVLLIDEIHNTLAGGPVSQRVFRNGIKSLGNKLNASIVCSGTEEAFNAFNTDSQLSNRFEPQFLPKWELDKEYASLLKAYERRTPLKYASNLHSDELALRIYTMSEGILGEIHEVIKRAAARAIKDRSEKITIKTLESIRWVAPSKRKQRQK